MAALYLHHALFASDPPSLPPTSARILHERQSSFSSVTLHASSDYSHPTEPLLHEGPSTASSAYLDILARQPVHPAEPQPPWNANLGLRLDPTTERERTRLTERLYRRRLRRLRWLKWVFMTVSGCWAAYTAIRYFIAFSLHKTPDQQTISLALGIVSALSLASLVLSGGVEAYTARFVRSTKSSPIFPKLHILLEYTASASLMSPAITNLVLTCIWRHSADPLTVVGGRCLWDIDVLWSITGRACEPSRTISWGYWLTGAIIRLAITAAILFTYHLMSFKYNVLPARSSQRKGARTHTHSVSYTSDLVRDSSLSMWSMSNVPVSLARSGRQPSQYTVGGQSVADSGSEITSPGHRTLNRASSSRISSEQLSADGRRDPSTQTRPPSEGHIVGPSTNINDERASLECFEEEDEGTEGDNGAYARYGRSIRHSPGAYAIAPVQHDLEREPSAASAENTLPAHNLHGFVDRFRELVDQVARETEAALELARNDQPGYYTDDTLSSPSPDSEDDSHTDYVPIVGSLIQRMPTIESLGSREVMSLAGSSGQRGDRSVHSLSRPPTRANTLSFSEATGSQPPSRSNSLTASVILTTPTEGQPPGNELACQMSKAPAVFGGNSRTTPPHHVAAGTSSSAGSTASNANGSTIIWPPSHIQSHTSIN